MVVLKNSEPELSYILAELFSMCLKESFFQIFGMHGILLSCPGLALLVATWNCWIDKLQKWICRTVGPSLAASLEPLAHCQNVARLSLFYRYYFGRCSPKLAQLVPLPYSQRSSTHYSDRLHAFSVAIPRCYKDVYVNSFFPHTAWLWKKAFDTVNHNIFLT